MSDKEKKVIPNTQQPTSPPSKKESVKPKHFAEDKPLRNSPPYEKKTTDSDKGDKK